MYLFLALFLAGIVIIFSLQNATVVTVSFLFWKFDASLVIVVFLAALIGIGIMAILSLSFRVKRSLKKGPATPNNTTGTSA